MTRLIVVGDDWPNEARDGLTTFLKAMAEADSANVAWWHHFPLTWMLVDRHSRGAVWWRDQIKDFAGGGRFLVFTVGEDASWAGVVNKTQSRWLHSSWK